MADGLVVAPGNGPDNGAYRTLETGNGPDNGAYRTLETKGETRIVIREIDTSLYRIARQYLDIKKDTLKLADDIKSVFMQPNDDCRVIWLPGPDDDPASTVNILQSFIDRVESFIDAVPNRVRNIHDIVLREEWESVHTDLQDVMHYYHTRFARKATPPTGPLGQWCSRGKGAKSGHKKITNSIYSALVKLAEQS
ncbi:hypothetical protein T484DRAFT_1757947 [Baffinella frigidus]|nr:hypothetical protein T484DRAFT_1757947 [Cryptophyta sp. CCMP2293]